MNLVAQFNIWQSLANRSGQITLFCIHEKLNFRHGLTDLGIHVDICTSGCPHFNPKWTDLMRLQNIKWKIEKNCVWSLTVNNTAYGWENKISCLIHDWFRSCCHSSYPEISCSFNLILVPCEIGLCSRILLDSHKWTHHSYVLLLIKKVCYLRKCLVSWGCGDNKLCTAAN